ncbi:MAG: aspartate/tyrosine/aromatic aminotransferase [Parvularculaceae bacterium]|nr:aspartate/tyrosine/aromatic aminotransferase [Parvularculaceae bacterium]
MRRFQDRLWKAAPNKPPERTDLMFADLAALPPDALLGLTKLYNDDKRTKKIDLGVGVFRTPDNRTPVLKAVEGAQSRLVERETTKVYLPPEGAPGFGDAIRDLVFGGSIAADRCAVVQTPGGCGALRVGAGLIKRAGAQGVTIGTPTWANHHPLLSAAGLKISMAPYYDAQTGGIDFDAFYESAARLGPGDALLLHGGCHNPTGADLSTDEIDALVDLAVEREFLPFVDCAYHGFAKGLDEDAYVMRRLAERASEFIVSYSCSKNFGLYRERTGALILVGASADRTAAMKSHVLNIARQIYSMPPAHGGIIVAEILTDAALNRAWREELEGMRRAVVANRLLLVKTAAERQLGEKLNYITRQNGMFSLLPVSDAQVLTLREKHGVYLAGGGRANMCGVNDGNVGHLCEALADVLAG